MNQYRQLICLLQKKEKNKEVWCSYAISKQQNFLENIWWINNKKGLIKYLQKYLIACLVIM